MSGWSIGHQMQSRPAPRFFALPALSTALLALLLLSPSPAVAKSYRHPLVYQTVTVEPDGSLRVTDRRSYEFDGRFQNAFLTIIPAAGGGVDFAGVEAVGGEPVRNVRIEGETLRWQYDARNETRTFDIGYALTGEITRAADAALFDRLLLEEEHATIDEYRVDFVLPAPARLFKVFIFTQLGRVGEMEVLPDSGRATVTIQSLRADEWVRARVLFDSELVPGLPPGAEPRYEAWLAETATESRNYRAGVRSALEKTGGADRPKRKPLPVAVAPLLAMVSGLFSWWAFRTWRSRGVEPDVANVGEYYREPAEEIPPAVVPFILDQFSPGISAASPALGSTLLDFARRGLVTLAEREKPSFLGLGGGREVDFVLARPPAAGELTPFETRAWQLLESARGEDGTVTPKELEKFFRKNVTWMQKWVEEPREWYERTKGPLLAGDHGLWMFLLIAGGIVLMAGLIMTGVFSGNEVVFLTGIVSGVTAGLFGLICGAAIPRWRPAALLRANQWRAYGRFLSDFSAMSEAPAEHYKLWDHHFIYATALGVSKKYLENLKKLMVQYPERFSAPAWILAGGGDPARGLGAVQSLDNIQANLATLQANLSALESALSTTTSSGGGFSGGGAGGASGGGGSSGAS